MRAKHARSLTGARKRQVGGAGQSAEKGDAPDSMGLGELQLALLVLAGQGVVGCTGRPQGQRRRGVEYAVRITHLPRSSPHEFWREALAGSDSKG
jgi:hypothetical protein